jgi:hypothetical protein
VIVPDDGATGRGVIAHLQKPVPGTTIRHIADTINKPNRAALRFRQESMFPKTGDIIPMMEKITILKDSASYIRK